MAREPTSDSTTPVSNAFRVGLRRELPRWRAEGLVDEPTERALVARYRLDARAADVTAVVIYLLGALLIGGGVISFVAWNWEHIPDAIKLALGGAAMLGADLLGHRWWKVTRTRPRIGQALVFLGTLLLGANIGLVAQVFHVHADWYGGFGAWAIGATVVAWALSSLPDAALGAVLTFVWSTGFVDDHEAWSALGPWLLAGAFLPLAVRTRSRALFALLAALFVIGLGVAAGSEARSGAAAFAAPLAGSAALVAWPFACRHGSAAAGFAPLARAMGVLGIGLVAYLGSFHTLAREFALARIDGAEWHWTLAAGPALAFALAATTIGWRRATDRTNWARAGAVGLASLAGACTLLLAMAMPQDSMLVAIVANAALVATAGVAVATSVRELERGPFWLGTTTLAVVVVTRFFEFETNLGIKAAAFVGSGIAVILVGSAFERRRRARGGGDAVA